MHRRYSRRHGRFDQPDPYDGSYDLADPQSFNRYAYVSNDPVNFVDPSGLEEEVVRVETWAPGWINPFFFGPDGPFGERGFRRPITEFEPRANGRLPGDLELPNTDSKDRGTDCTRFADEVGRMAAKHLYDLPGLANALSARFASEGERRSSKDFASTGFKTEFRDDTPSAPGLRDKTPNQVRRYVAGFRAFTQGGLLGKAYANHRERPGQTPSQKADLALNRVSTQHAQTWQ